MAKTKGVNVGRPPNPIDPNSSLAARFGWKIRTLREQRGWSLEELGNKVACSASYLSRLERGVKSPDEAVARQLDAALGTTYFSEHWQLVLRERLSQPGRAQTEHEFEAAVIRACMPNLIFGLLQTEEYARAIVMSGPFRNNVDVMVAERMRRQEVLTREHPPRLVVVLDEVALRRVVGGVDVHRAQLERLEAEMNKPHVTLQVVPADAGEYPGLVGGFEILSFTGKAPLAYVEGPGGTGHMVDSPSHLAALDETFDLSRAVALPTKATAQMIRQIREEL
ncbi:transcriptional regulator, XRE family [Thermomonospora curvata DSM 43183]|uniref:Transcriptional regulator, XRE family n=1 Tax=Thermomonospora curvata (strain ATCC 19995 / DSM 43183 / JCM 3096 / KCTC 9072 / NBRC 15933 / NCIMB 10081 / Henssen B9) TaxID=471852 RepID=D1AD04_THECD|nr:transcriptional regulator, XRE family [Thermomonospora curvata DSM 43183]